MKSFVVLVLTSLLIGPAMSAGTKLDKIPENVRTEADAIVLPAGTALMIEQLLERNKSHYQYNEKSDYSVNFLCEKVKKKSKCRLVDLKTYNFD